MTQFDAPTDPGSLLDNRLREHRTNRAELSDRVRRELAEMPLPACFAYGSIVEGLGNSGSDLDLAVIVPGELAITPQSNRRFDLNGLEVDVLLLPATTLRELGAKLHELVPRSERDNALGTSYAERRMAHAVLAGVELFGVADPAALAGISGPLLSGHLIRSACYWICNMQLDAKGMLLEADNACAIAVAQEIVWRAADVVLASAGQTNCNPKWRPALLRRLDALTDDPLLQTGGLTPAELVYRLHRAPEAADSDSAWLQVAGAARFARRAMLLAAQGAGQALSDPSGLAPGPGFPDLDIDVALKQTQDGIAVFRPSGPQEALVLPQAAALSLAMLGTEVGAPCQRDAIGPTRQLVRLLAAEGLIRRPDQT